MTLQEQRYDFDSEVDRIELELQETAETLADLEEGNPARESLLNEGQQLDAQLAGVRWARDKAHLPSDEGGAAVWTEDVDGVTLGGLTGGEFGRVSDELVAGDGAGGGATRVLLVANGTVAAPYIDDGMDDDERAANAGNLPITYLKWAEARVNELTTVGGNGGMRFSDFLGEARQNQTSADATDER